MRIHFERVGGFAGIRLKADVDTDTLPPEEAKSWQALEEKAQLGQIRQSSGADSRTRDSFEYWLTGRKRREAVLRTLDRRNAATHGNASD